MSAHALIIRGARDCPLRARRLRAPWSAPRRLAQGAPALDGSWDYGLLAHPELAREDGALEYASYFQPGKFLDGTIHLLEIDYRAVSGL